MIKPKKLNYTFTILLTILIICFCVGNLLCKNVVVNAEYEEVYSTSAIISKQGENGFYYAWGLPSKYVLMTYGALVNKGGYGWRGIENYSKISGSGMHPGAYFGVLNVWVAKESGTISLDGYVEKGTIKGDGVNIGVYHQEYGYLQEYGGKLNVIFEKFIKEDDLQRKHDINEVLNVSKGDSIIFYCDSGNAKNKDSDNVNTPFTITYTEKLGDSQVNEDLSKYLNVKSAGEVAGFKHVEQEFQAENLDGTKSKNSGCALTLSTVSLAPISLLSFLMIRRKKK